MCKISGAKFSQKSFLTIGGTVSKKMNEDVISYGLCESAILSLTDEPKFDPPQSSTVAQMAHFILKFFENFFNHFYFIPLNFITKTASKQIF